jgi:hypothetical protein
MIHIKTSMRRVLSMYLPSAHASTNEVIYNVRSRNVVTGHFRSTVPHPPPGRELLPIELFRQACCSPASELHLARWFQGTGGIDTPLSTHGYFSPPAKTDGRQSVARNVSVFRRTGRPSTNRPAAGWRELKCVVRVLSSKSTGL